MAACHSGLPGAMRTGLSSSKTGSMSSVLQVQDVLQLEAEVGHVHVGAGHEAAVDESASWKNEV